MQALVQAVEEWHLASETDIQRAGEGWTMCGTTVNDFCCARNVVLTTFGWHNAQTDKVTCYCSLWKCLALQDCSCSAHIAAGHFLHLISSDRDWHSNICHIQKYASASFLLTEWQKWLQNLGVTIGLLMLACAGFEVICYLMSASAFSSVCQPALAAT